MAVDPQLLGPSTLAITQSVGLFQGFLPKFSDIRRHTPGADLEFDRDVHMGEAAATALALGIGLIVTNLTGSPVPVIVALVSSLFLIALYESALKSQGETANYVPA